MAQETSFTSLVGVPVHYDRLPAPNNYGSKGEARSFHCTNKLKSTLEDCLTDLFAVWGRPRPSIILTAGTTGDGGGAHGQGLAFDIDGFYWDDQKFLMDQYPIDRKFYIGINSHLFLHFSQVLSYHYPRHHDHFHVDFNFSFKYRPESNAQTFFVQACLVYLFDHDLGKTGTEQDGVDGIYGSGMKAKLSETLADLNITSITTTVGWKSFLKICRGKAFNIPVS